MYGSPLGRLLVGILAGLLVFSVVVWNLPAGEVRDDLRADVRPLVRTLGLDQTWSLFSPDPSRTSVDVRAEIHFTDGTVEIDRLPDGDPLIGALREYRWRKYERRLREDDNVRLSIPAAEWFAHRHASPSRPVAQVVFVRRVSTTPDPGSADDRVWEDQEFYSREFDPPITGDES